MRETPWSNRNQQITKAVLASEGKKRHDYRFCASCKSYQPKNKMPHVAGWKCTSCLTVQK